VLHGQLPTAGPQVERASDAEPEPIRDNKVASLSDDVSEACAITGAKVSVGLRHSYVGDLRVVLHTPGHEALTLQRHAGADRSRLQRTWTLADAALRALAGRSTAGRWTLVVYDDAGDDEGTLERFDLRLTCGEG